MMRLISTILCLFGWHRVPNKYFVRRKPVAGKLTYPFWDWEGSCVRCKAAVKGTC